MRTENKTSKLLQAPKNTSEQDAISLSFVSDWSRGWRQLFRPITEQNEAKPSQSRISLNAHLKSVL